MLWAALATGVAIGAGMAARHGAAAAWRHTRHEEPPINPADTQASWPSVLAWAAVSGFCVAAARAIGYSAASGAWRKALGHQPPT